jgi:type I restriction enzyme, S subunit
MNNEQLLSTLIDEISMGPFGSDIKVDNFIEAGVPVLNGSNLSGYKLTENSFKYVSEEKANTFKKAIARRGDIVITHRGTLGQISFIPEDSKYDKYVISQSQFRVRFNDKKIDPRFIVYLFHTEYGRKKLLSFKNHVGVPALAQATSNFKRLELNFPDISSQKNIATVLSILDQKIELNNKINDNLEQTAKTIYDYWFVQFDFPDNGGKPYKSSGGEMVFDEILKKEIPNGWEVSTIAKMAKTGSGGTPLSTNSEYYEGGNIAWINSGETNNPFIITTKNFITEFGMKNSSAKIFPKDSLLMAMYGATAGKVSLLKIEATTNQAICAIIPKVKEYTYLLKYSLESIYQYLINLSSGSARDNLSQDKIKNIQVIKPEENILREFHLIVDGLYDKYYNNAMQNQELTLLRDWLLPMLINGQVTVKETIR